MTGQPSRLGDSARARCPSCGWEVNDDRTPEEVQKLIDDGWLWCADGHDKVALVLVPVGQNSPA